MIVVECLAVVQTRTGSGGNRDPGGALPIVCVLWIVPPTRGIFSVFLPGKGVYFGVIILGRVAYDLLARVPVNHFPYQLPPC